MEHKGGEKRACIRFLIPGATVSYKLEKPLLSKKKRNEEFCPLADISRGGLRFLSQESLNIDDEVSLKIAIPGEQIPLFLKGKVRWTAPKTHKKYKQQTGVQFYPYGEKKGQNYPGALVKIIALEQKFAYGNKEEPDQFEVDG